MSSELENISPSSPIRQGDILKWEEPATLRESQPWAVIITADCDFAQEKTTGIVTYLPIIPEPDYVRRYWAIERLRVLRQKSLSKILKTLSEMKDDQTEAILPDWAIIEWLKEESVENISKKILGEKLSHWA